jgi:hypothetical protein
MFGWLSPSKEVIECAKFRHLDIVDKEPRLQIPEVKAVDEQIEKLRIQCEEDSKRDGATNAEWHLYEIASDGRSRSIWNALIRAGFIRIGTTHDKSMCFEGTPTAIKDKMQLCKDLAEELGYPAIFTPVK